MLRPIDMQVLLPKAQEVAKTNYIRNDSAQNQQAMFSIELKKSKQIEEKRIQKNQESKNLRLNPDESNKRDNKNESRKNKNKDSRAIDIKI
jgi:hypothetical protein